MKANLISDPFFTGPAILLVEDERTRAALTGLWFRDPAAKRILVRAAGGRVGVETLATASRENGRKHVYGLVDRDFGAAGRSLNLFRTERHEFENHLLDFESLAKLHEHATADEMRARAERRASSLTAWMAVRRTIHEAKTALLRTPPDPKAEGVLDAEAARQWFDALQYPEDVEREIRRTWTRTYLKDNRFPQHLRDCEADFESGNWMLTFSGKEVFVHLAAQGGWRHSPKTADDLSELLVGSWGRRDAPPVCLAFLKPIRDAIVRECGL